MKTTHILIQVISIAAFASICFFTPPAVSYSLLVLLFLRIIIFVSPTKGKKIQSFENPREALLVIDMQEAMCGKSGDYPQKEEFVKRANQFIDKAQ